MARIVALVGSPNVSGNTSGMVDSILDGAMGLSTSTIECYNLWKIRANDRGEYILHCHDKAKPVLDESAQTVLDSILAADLMVFATPVYFGMPTSQFQLVLEYMYSMISADFSKSKLKGKKAIVAVSCTEINDSSLNVLDTIVRSLGGFQIEVVNKMIYQDCKGPFKDDPEARKKAATVGSRFIFTFDVEPEDDVLRLN